MNEGKTRKKHSLWWIWLILLLAAFAGGTVFGLKLSTMPGPSALRDSLMTKMGTAIPALAEQDAEEAPAPEVTETAEPMEQALVPAETPETAETSTPAETPAPAETAAPAELPAVAEAAVPAANEAPAAPKYIGVDAALEKALAYAKVEKDDAEVLGVTRTKDDDGVTVYEVAFKSGETTYEYVLDAVTGELEGFKLSGFTFSETETYVGHTPLEDFDNVGIEPETAESVEEAETTEAAEETQPEEAKK